MEHSEKTLDMIVALCKNRGFVFPGSEIYGGLANSWDYGPLGVEFKNNVKKAWLKKFVQESPYNVGLDAAILMNPQTWVTTGHVASSLRRTVLRYSSSSLMACRPAADITISCAMSESLLMFKMCGHGDKSRKLAFLTRAQGLPLCPNLSIIIATPRDVNQNTALISANKGAEMGAP